MSSILYKMFPGGKETGAPAKPALWGEEKPRHSRNFPLAGNGALWLAL